MLASLVALACASSLIGAEVLQHRQERSGSPSYASAPAVPAPSPGPAAPEPPVTSTPPPPPSAPPQPSAPPKPPAPPKPKPLAAKGVPCVAGVHACVRLSSRQAWLLDGVGHVLLGPVPITSGKKGARTATGMWTVLWKDKDHKSEEFDDAPMPYSVFFEPGGIAFHTGSLRAQSSGCIHLANSVAARFYGNLRVGDGVQVLK